MQTKAGYHLMALFTVLVWGTTFVSTKVLIVAGLTPTEIFFYRFLLAYAGMWFVYPRFERVRSWRDELLFAAAGACGGSLYFVTENTALGITLASNVALLLCTTPILTAFVSRLFGRSEPLSRNLVTGSLVALSGVALVVFNGRFVLQINPLGDLLTLIAALTWAFYGMLLHRLEIRYPNKFVTRKVFFYGLVTLLPWLFVSPVRFDATVLAQPVVWGNLLFLGAIASLLCFLLWNESVWHLGVVATSNYLYLVPVVTLFVSSLLLDEPVTTVALAGSVLILGGVYLAGRRSVRPARG